MTLEELRAKREEIERVAAARGEARPDSDVDFVVDFEPQRTVLDLSGLILDLEELLGQKVDVVEIRRPTPLGDAIRLQAVTL